MRSMQSRQITPMLRSVEPADRERLIEMDEQITGTSRRDFYERRLLHEPGDLRVSIGAEVGGVLVGAILGTLRDGEFGVPEPIAVVDTVLVDRALQGRGIATAMLEQLALNLRAFGVRRIRTELSWEDHQLDGFLSRRGFAPIPRKVLEMTLPTSAGAGAAPGRGRHP
jgi:GNAT superfamily N-acetyltransferase